MLKRSAKEIAKVCGGKLLDCENDIIIGKFVNNDKMIEENCCYVALNGERYKGIDFALGAIRGGASLVLADTDTDERIPRIAVDDARVSLARIAAYFREKERKTVVAVTGSVGKTTTKELCAAVISGKEPVLKTEGNRNNTVGLPFTLLSDCEAKTAVLEAGISEKGEMSVLSAIARPDIAIITGIGVMHAETLGSRAEIAKEKLKILESASKECVLIIPENEPLLSRADAKKVIRVGIDSKSADYSASNISFTNDGSYFDVLKKGKPFITRAFVSIIGEHGVLDALFACTLGDILGIDECGIRRGLMQYKPVENRQNIIVKNDVTLIADCYNFGPESARAALRTLSILAQRNAGKTVLLLGSMLELGDEGESIHVALGKEIAKCGFDALITVGEIARNIALGALIGGMDNVCDFGDTERDKAAACLKEQVTQGAVVLIKGSRKMKMEEFIPIITE